MNFCSPQRWPVWVTGTERFSIGIELTRLSVQSHLSASGAESLETFSAVTRTHIRTHAHTQTNYTALCYDLWLNTAWKKTQMPVAKWCPPHTKREHSYTTTFCLFEVTAVTSDEWFMEIFVFAVHVHVFTLDNHCVLPYSPLEADKTKIILYC